MSNNDNNMNVIKDYILKEKLGTGSYGVVYKVLNKNDKNIYVLKQISLFSMDKNQIDEVKNESNILSSLDSKYVVRYYDSFIENNCLNIVMEYCDGGDLALLLRQGVKTGKFIPEEKIWKIFIQICIGLNYIHSKKILHRDLKTMNIFLMKENEQVRIGDLGVAKVLNQNSFANTFVGTPYYLSPEICEEKPYNEKSDVWALGCILYEMATYKHPFNATNQGALILKILKGTYEPINIKEYSLELKRTIEMLLEKLCDKRPNIKDILKNPMVIKKIKQYNLTDYLIEEGFGNLIKKDRDESNKDLVNISNNNLNVSNLNLEKFKKLALNNDNENKKNSQDHDNKRLGEKEKGLGKNLKKQQNRPMSRAKEIVREPNQIKNLNLHAKKNSNAVNLSPVNVRKSENFNPINVNNILNSKDKEKEKAKDVFGKEADLDTDKLKKRLAEIENIMNNLDNHKKIINNIDVVKKENNLNINKRKSVQHNEKNKINNNLNIKKLEIDISNNNNANKFHSDKNLVNDKNRIDSDYNKNDFKSNDYRQTTDSSKLYAINSTNKETAEFVNMYRHSDLLAEFSENYKNIGEGYLEDSKVKGNNNIDIIESVNFDTMGKNTAYFLKDNKKATDFIKELKQQKSDKSEEKSQLQEKQKIIKKQIEDKIRKNLKPLSSNKNTEQYKIQEPNLIPSPLDTKLDKNQKNIKPNNPSVKQSNNNIKKDNFIFENNFMKNIKIDDKIKDKSETNISVNKSSKKDNKFETIESKKENIMKIPKVFQLKYNNLAEKKTNSNNNINCNSNINTNLNDNSNSKITANTSANETDNVNSVNNNFKNLSIIDLSNNNNKEVNEDQNNQNINKENLKKDENNEHIIKKIGSEKNSENIDKQKINKDNKILNDLNSGSKFGSLIKQKIDIIHNVPLFSNNENEQETSFIVNVVNNNNEINNEGINEIENSSYQTFNKKANNNMIENKNQNKLKDLDDYNQNLDEEDEYTENENEESEDESYDSHEHEEESENNSIESEEVVVLKHNRNKEQNEESLEIERKEYTEKLNLYKKKMFNDFGEEKSEIILSFYRKKTYNNDDNYNNNELIEELGKLMTETFPENFLVFAQIFNNYVYYDIELQSVLKKLLNTNKSTD